MEAWLLFISVRVEEVWSLSVRLSRVSMVSVLVIFKEVGAALLLVRINYVGVASVGQSRYLYMSFSLCS